MYGRGSAGLATVTTGTSSAIAGIAILPNTGGSLLLTAVSVISILVGVGLVISFFAARAAKLYYR